MASQLKRKLHKGMSGPDVLAVKRALKAAGFSRGIILNRAFGTALDRQLRQFQKTQGLLADGVYGQKTHERLWKHFDDYGKKLLDEAPIADPRDEKFATFISYMELMTRETPGYGWGSGHGIPLAQVRVDQKLDCSSSTSKALYENGMFPGKYSLVSGEFRSWGEPGPGEYFSIYYSGLHVWIRLLKGKYYRFDTSPHGDGGRGPRLRTLPRFTTGFGVRHWKGM